MCKRGDIYYADLGSDNNTSEQSGVRPVLIVSNDKANTHSPVVTVVPMTGKLKKRDLPTHVIITPKVCSGLNRPSMALAEQVVSIDKSRLQTYRGCVSDGDTMRLVTKALEIQIGAK